MKGEHIRGDDQANDSDRTLVFAGEGRRFEREITLELPQASATQIE